jgi:hypothetical protein
MEGIAVRGIDYEDEKEEEEDYDYEDEDEEAEAEKGKGIDYLITKSSAVHMILSGPAERISISLPESW